MRGASVAALLALALTSALRAAPRCPAGAEPRLSGDAFSPVDCSTTTKPSALLPGAPAAASKDDALKELAGRWEGSISVGIGRYALLAEVKTRWFGKAELTLKLKELQFRQRVTDTLTLAPAKDKGAYDAELSSELLPDARLSGTARLGDAPQTAPPPAPGERQADLLLANGAAHRLRWLMDGKDALTLRVWSSVPGAPPQHYETRLRRATKDSL